MRVPPLWIIKEQPALTSDLTNKQPSGKSYTTNYGEMLNISKANYDIQTYHQSAVLIRSHHNVRVDTMIQMESHLTTQIHVCQRHST